MTFMKHALAMSVALVGVSSVAVFAPVVAYADDVSECACLTAFQGNNMSVGKMISAEGDVRVSQAAGYVKGEKDASLSVGSRIMVGPKSSARFQVGTGCNISVAQNSTADISRVGQSLCVKMQMPETTASYGQAGQESGGGFGAPEAMAGIAFTTSGIAAAIEANTNNGSCVSPAC